MRQEENQLPREKKTIQAYLAVDRTILANERTFLAYMRTALTLFVVGASFIKFFDFLILEVVGWIFVPLAVFAGIMGFKRYQRTRRLIHEVEAKNGFFIPDL